MSGLFLVSYDSGQVLTLGRSPRLQRPRGGFLRPSESLVLAFQAFWDSPEAIYAAGKLRTRRTLVSTGVRPGRP